MGRRETELDDDIMPAAAAFHAPQHVHVLRKERERSRVRAGGSGGLRGTLRPGEWPPLGQAHGRSDACEAMPVIGRDPDAPNRPHAADARSPRAVGCALCLDCLLHGCYAQTDGRGRGRGYLGVLVIQRRQETVYLQPLLPLLSCSPHRLDIALHPAVSHAGMGKIALVKTGWDGVTRRAR